MIISLNELNKRETGKIDLNFSKKIDNISYCDNTYKLASPISLIGKISKNAKDEVHLRADVDFTLIDNCSRCLEPVEVPMSYTIDGFLVSEDFDEDSFEDYDAFIIDTDEVDLVKIIEQTLDFNLPQKVLCDEDCKGLCPKCGANLNKETCSCSETASDEDDNIDPRFAKLKDLFKND